MDVATAHAVDAIVVWNAHVVVDVDAGYGGLHTALKVQGPVRRVANGEVAD